MSVPFDWVRDILAKATPYELAVNVPYALAFALIATEVAWLAARGKAILRSAATAAGMAAGALAVGVLYTVALRWLWNAVATFGWEPLVAFWQDHPVGGAAVAFVAWDASGWLYHLIGHRTRIGWAAHQPHHSGEEYDATLGLRQSWAPFHGLIHHPLLALAGFDLRVIVVCAAVSNGWQLLEHTSLPVRFPRWIEANVMTPAAHRHHHGRDGGAVNLGPIFTWWDRIGRTWVSPDEPPPVLYGPATPTSANPLTVELAGWRHLARSYHSCARRKTTTCPAWARAEERAGVQFAQGHGEDRRQCAQPCAPTSTSKPMNSTAISAPKSNVGASRVIASASIGANDRA